MQKRYLVFVLVALFVFCSCHEKKKNISVSLATFNSLCKSSYEILPNELDDDIRHLVASDRNRCTADVHTRRHYNGDSITLVWVTRNGVSAKADTLLSFISKVDSIGFSKEYFYYTLISNDLKRVRNLSFDEESYSVNNINKVYARLEYYLTKAFLRYTEGQRFGFVNPYEAFNKLDVRDSDSIRVSYRSLYGAPTRLPNKEFVTKAFSVMASSADSVAKFLHSSQPQNPIFKYYVAKLHSVALPSERRIILCNMERSRWGNGNYPQTHKKFLIVNIPSLSLWAHDENEDITMRIGVGSLETKTPIITSFVKRMDFNPQWVMPKSIVKKSVCPHAGNNSYFESHNYFIRERNSGKVISPENVTSSMLLSKDYSVVQRGGMGNALGRVIFRFDNDYSIFLHDTSNPGVFSRIDRTVSHGCIRVERPYDLAVFMLANKDEKLMEKMKYSMTVKYGEQANEPNGENINIDRSMMVRSVNIKPLVPIYITYYTLYPDKNGTLIRYNDIYGYDEVIYKRLQQCL